MQLWQLAGTDPYTEMQKGPFQRQQFELEKQKQDIQKLQLQEQAKFLQEEQTKDLGGGLEKQSQQVVPPNWKLTDEQGMPTVAGQMNDFLMQSSQEGKLAKQAFNDANRARAIGDVKGYGDLLDKARRLETSSTNSRKQAMELAKKTQNDAIYGLATAQNKNEWDNIVKSWEKNGLPIPPNFPTEFSPDNVKKVASLAPAELQTKINDELRKVENEKRKDAKERRDEERMVLAERREARIEAKLDRVGAGQGEEKAQKMSAEQSRSQRSINALGGVKSALETINEFEIGTNVGMLPSLTTKDGMINAVRNYTGRKLTPVSADQLNTVFSGIGRNLAAIETSGLATGLAELSKSLQSGVYINPGKDDPYSVAMKLADIRRIAVENIRPAIDSGAITPKQAETAKQLVGEIEKLVPYTTTDVAKATRLAKGKGKKSIGESTQEVMTSKEITKDDSDLINKYLKK